MSMLHADFSLVTLKTWVRPGDRMAGNLWEKFLRIFFDLGNLLILVTVLSTNCDLRTTRACSTNCESVKFILFFFFFAS